MRGELGSPQESLPGATSSLAELRDYLHSRDRDRVLGRYSQAADHVRRSADLRARVHELGQDAIADDDEQLARKALRLRDLIDEMDRTAGHTRAFY